MQTRERGRPGGRSAEKRDGAVSSVPFLFAALCPEGSGRGIQHPPARTVCRTAKGVLSREAESARREERGETKNRAADRKAGRQGAGNRLSLRCGFIPGVTHHAAGRRNAPVELDHQRRERCHAAPLRERDPLARHHVAPLTERRGDFGIVRPGDAHAAPRVVDKDKDADTVVVAEKGVALILGCKVHRPPRVEDAALPAPGEEPLHVGAEVTRLAQPSRLLEAVARIARPAAREVTAQSAVALRRIGRAQPQLVPGEDLGNAPQGGQQRKGDFHPPPAAANDVLRPAAPCRGCRRR